MMDGAPTSKSLPVTAISLSLLATVVLEIARAEWSPPGIVSLVGLVALIAGVFWAANRLSRGHDSARVPSLAVVQLVLLTVSPFAAELVTRSGLNLGESFELQVLTATRNLMLGLAGFSRWRACQRLSSLLSVFLVLAGTTLSSNVLAFAAAVLYGIVGLWWLMGTYWDRLQGRFAEETERQIPVRAGLLALVLVAALAVCGAAVIGAGASTTAIAGLFPSSGGNRWHDPHARGGVNDGDMLVAAQEEAASFGPVESDLFLDSEMPTLFDVESEEYGEPLRKRKANDRAIGLNPTSTAEIKQRIALASKAGREFSAVRRPAKRKLKEQADQTSPAMLQVLGTTPLHLRLEAFELFDGVTWAHAAPAEKHPPLYMETRGDKPWLRGMEEPRTELFAQTQRHVLRIVNLKTNRIPVPPNLVGLHISKVDQAWLFGWTPEGGLEMPQREAIPPLTVINLESRRLVLREVRQVSFVLPENLADQRYLERPESLRTGEIESLARQWAGSLPRGWEQIESVVRHLRDEYAHDRDAPAPAECDDVAAHFLFDAKRGPDYLFATSAAVLLRSLGYSARVVSGFYADPRKFDRRARQTPVAAEDLHFWAEVSPDGRTWLTIEPTPGYVVAPPILSWPERLVAALQAACVWTADHVPPVAALLGALVTSVVFRRGLFDLALRCAWLVGDAGSMRRRMLWTLRLLEWRSWLAGKPRPKSCTLAKWYGPLAQSRLSLRQSSNLAPREETFPLAEREGYLAGRWLALAEWVLYAPGANSTFAGSSRWSESEARELCHWVIAHWTWKRLRAAFLTQDTETT